MGDFKGASPLKIPQREIICQGQAPDTPVWDNMGLRPKPHKLFEKSLTKNLIKCQGENETEVSFLPPTPPVGGGRKLGLRPKPHKFFEKNLIKNLMGKSELRGLPLNNPPWGTANSFVDSAVVTHA